MRDHPRGRPPQWGAVAISVLSLCMTVAVSQAAAEDDAYVNEDVRIIGKALHAFTDGGKQVSVVEGDFQLKLAGRMLSGRDAVIWIRRMSPGRVARRELTVYVEGRARLVSPDGTTLTGRSMLVTLHHIGSLRASAKLIKGPLKDRSLYERALAARNDRSAAANSPATYKPPIIVFVEAPPKAPKSATKPRRDAKTSPPPVERKPDTPTADAAKRIGRAKDPKSMPPVMFHAENVSSRFIGDGDKRRRVTIARGGVYLAQGDPDSDMFLEMRCDAAVIFSTPRNAGAGKSPAGANRPGSPLATLTLGQGSKERILGVYLEGDVVIARGERYLRGPRAYYDFTTNRSIVVNGVFRTIQQQRDIPIFIRSREARTLSDRELWFSGARVTSSDFLSPTYHIAAGRVYLKDLTPYDAKGVRIGRQKWETKMHHCRFCVHGVPITYWPYIHEQFEEFHTSLRKLQLGNQGKNMGYGVESEWRLFRLLGLTKPAGFRGRFNFSYYERGILAGASVKYVRRKWSGYTLAYRMIDNRGRDDFGSARDDISVPDYRGRFTHRHKYFLPDNWQVQAEFSWCSDRTFNESFFPSEFYAGKTQETLLYAKKQRDNLAFTALLQYRLNRFDTQTESAPDLSFYAIGEPAAGDKLTLFSETRVGFKRWRPDKASKTSTRTDSDIFGRVDSREEVNWPIHLGPVNLAPYAVGRITHWGDSPTHDNQCRQYGQIGARADTHLWRIYPNIESRMWDLHHLKHVITPELAVFGSDLVGIHADDVFDMDDNVERHLNRQSGYAVAVRQRLMTKRGQPGQRQPVDWMRLDVTAGRFRNHSPLPADGRWSLYRPEYSLARNHVNADYLWSISGDTTILADANYDTHTGTLGRSALGLDVRRSPRLSYFGGLRSIRDLDSSVITAGFNYKLTRKYSIACFEQYDLDYSGGDNLGSRMTITRKLPRWFVSLTLIFDQDGGGDNVGVYVNLWPEGVPEVKLGSGSRGFLSSTDMN